MTIQYDAHGRPDPPLDADETTSLLAFLDNQRATLAWKCDGLDADRLAVRIGGSSLSLGGLLHHLARVEDLWCSQRLVGRPPAQPWDTVDWEADPDWDWHQAASMDPEALRRRWREAVSASRQSIEAALAAGGLDHRAAWVDDWYDTPPTVRWILTHLIREYARHNGHADLLREAADGATGE